MTGWSLTATADNEYMVEKGDTLYGIGKLLGVPYQEIMKANGLKNGKIYPDQILKIPSAGKRTEGDMAATATQRKAMPAVVVPSPVEKPIVVASAEAPPMLTAEPEVERDTRYYVRPQYGQAEGSYLPPIQGRSRSRPEAVLAASTYTVQQGDTIWSISRRFNVSAWDLRKANDIQYSHIQPGQVLNLPTKLGTMSIAAN